MDSYSTPHRDSVSSVIFGIDVSGGCYILGGSLSDTSQPHIIYSYSTPIGTVYLVMYQGAAIF